MRSRKFPILLVTVLSAALGGCALGQSQSTREVGGAVPLSHPHDRQITLKPGAKYVNVTRGDCVEFIVDGKAFAWNFDMWNTGNFPMAEIAPKNVQVADVQVWVGPNRFDRYR